jgi:hypothetical protein
MWDNDEDDLEEMNQEEEKFEDNSKMAGEKLDDEMRTKDEAEDARMLQTTLLKTMAKMRAKISIMTPKTSMKNLMVLT